MGPTKDIQDTFDCQGAQARRKLGFQKGGVIIEHAPDDTAYGPMCKARGRLF